MSLKQRKGDGRGESDRNARVGCNQLKCTAATGEMVKHVEEWYIQTFFRRGEKVNLPMHLHECSAKRRQFSLRTSQAKNLCKNYSFLLDETHGGAEIYKKIFLLIEIYAPQTLPTGTNISKADSGKTFTFAKVTLHEFLTTPQKYIQYDDKYSGV